MCLLERLAQHYYLLLQLFCAHTCRLLSIQNLLQMLKCRLRKPSISVHARLVNLVHDLFFKITEPLQLYLGIILAAWGGYFALPA